MKSPYLVLECIRSLLTDISRSFGVALRAPDDIDMNWVLIEGPQLDKLLLKEIETGELPELPLWLKPLWERWFTLREPLVLRALRQVLVFGYKIETEPTDEQLTATESQFVSTDEALDIFNSVFNGGSNQVLYRETAKVVSRVIARCNFASIKPSHGPGAVYPSRRPSEKARFETIYPTIDEYYPYFDYFGALTSRIEDGLRVSSSLSLASNITCKLVAVPKDSRGPRLISTQPAEAIWIQQGLRAELERAITNHPYTKSKINFDDQSVNGRLALTSSLDRKYATIDLKEASDRISIDVFNFLFGSHARYFNACRATEIVLFDGRVHRLRKYAPMGNATVFPVQSLIFYAICRSAISCHCGEICDDVYVFGDDIIVPTRYLDACIRGLVRFGLVPNQNKTFGRGLFRESCGVDAYSGVDVTPSKLKVGDVSSPSDLVSLCAFAKRMRAQGYQETSSVLYSYARAHSARRIALSNDPDCQGLVEYVDYPISFIARNDPSFRWNKFLHRYEVASFQSVPLLDEPVRHDWYHVMDSIRSNTGTSRGVRYAIPRRSRFERGWTQVRW